MAQYIVKMRKDLKVNFYEDDAKYEEFLKTVKEEEILEVIKV